jgi:hypothetical protein
MPLINMFLKPPWLYPFSSFDLVVKSKIKLTALKDAITRFQWARNYDRSFCHAP